MCEKTKTWLKLLVVALLATCFSVSLRPTPAGATAGLNHQIAFEGKVVSASGVNIPDGTYNMEFKIYQDGTGVTGGGGTLKWTEDHLVSASTAVTVTAGTFEVNLGSVCGGFGSGTCGANTNTGVDFNQSTLWLSMNVGGTASTPSYDGEMSPYIRLTAVPQAENANTVGGLSASQLVQLTPGTQQTGSINVSGNIQTAGTLQAATIDTPSSGTLTVGSTNTSALTLGANTTITSGKTLTVGGQQVFSGTGILQAAALSSSIAYSNLTQVGTITAGTWTATAVGAAYGGTGQSTYTVGDLLYASATTTLSKLSDVAVGSCLISGGTATAPTWGSCTSGSANAALSNLASVAINTSLLPGVNNSIDAGSATLGFRSGYFATSVYTPLVQTASGTNLTITAGGTATLSLDSGSAGGTVNVGPTNATTVNVGTGTGAVATTVGSANTSANTYVQGGATKETINNSGDTIQTGTNSATGFQIQDAAGAPVLLVDTTSTTSSGAQLNYLKYPGFESGSFSNAAAGWAASSPATLSQNTTKLNTYNGLYSAKIVTTASNGGLTTSSFVSAPPSGNYIVSFYAEVGSGTMASTAFTVTTTGGTGSCTGVGGTTINANGFQRVYCQLTASGAVTGLTIAQIDSTARTIYIDAVQMQSTTFNSTTITQPTPYQIGAIQLRGVITNPVSIINNGDSIAAFQIQNANGNSNLFVADTLDSRIGIGTSAPAALLSVGTTSQLQVDGSGDITAAGTYNGDTLTASALTFSGSSAATIQSASGQNLALNTGTAAGTISTNAGTIQRITSGGSTTTLDLDDTGTTTFKLYNSGSGVANLWLYGGGIYTGTGQTLRLDNTGVLQNVTYQGNTVGVGYGGTGITSATQYGIVYGNGTSALGVLAPGTAGYCLTTNSTSSAPSWASCGGGGGANTALSNLASVAINTSLLPASNNAIDAGSSSLGFRTGYFATSVVTPAIQSASGAALTITANAASTWSSTNNLTIQAGGTDVLALDTGGAGTVNLGNTNATTVNIGPTGSTATTAQLNLGTTTGDAQDINIGGTGLSGGSNSGTNVALQGGQSLLWVLNSGTLVQSLTNSTTAFEVQNSAGVPIFIVDTSTSQSANYLSYGGFEVGTTTPTGWSAYGSPTTFVRNTAAPNHYGGQASLQIVASAANQGATTSSFTSTPPTSTYTFSFYALQTAGTALTSANFSTIVNGSATAACTSGTSLVATGFVRVVCPIASIAPTSITIEETSSSATFYIDGAQLVTGSTPTPATTGAIQLRGAIDSPAVFQTLSNSTTAFQIQNTAGTSNLFVVDTLNSVIHIGASTTLSSAGNSVTTGTVFSPSIQSGSGLVTIGGSGNGGISVNTISNLVAINNSTLGGGAISLGGTSANGNITIGGGSGTINIGNSGTGAITLGSTGAAINLLAATYTTTTKGVQIGSATASTTPTLLELNQGSLASGSETTGSCTTTINDGAMYYNTASGAMRACINGNWEDMVSTSGLGILAFGVIPDSGNAGAPGDLGGITGYTNSPCKVTWLSTTSVQVNKCTLYTGGHKINVAQTTVSVAALAASTYANICFSTSTGAVSSSATPTLLTGSTTETSATVPVFSANNPVECLATVETTTTAGTLGNIWDSRTFTNTQKEFTTVNSANALDYLVVGSTTPDVLTTSATAGTGPIAGILVATAGTASSTTINAIMATSNDAYVAIPAASPTDVVNNIVETTGTAGFAQTVASNASTTVYAYAGILERPADTTCTAATNCQYSGLVRLDISR